ncbi:MAG: hypothetical protein ACRD0I_04070, partial [Acidimicrobiales bacterium]
MNVGTVLGPYELGEQLGQGTWGLSYRARRADGPDYPLPGSTAEAPAWSWVVKVIPTSADRSLALRVRSCAKAWSCLGHPGILVPTEILEDGESVALVYEFQVRGSLAGARGSL